MANKQAPRRNDLIRCENCGEEYSVTYRRCPFCDARPGQKGGRPAGGTSGRRVATNTRGGGYGGPVNPVQIVMLVVTLVVIIAAVFIVIKTLGPLFHKDPVGMGSSISASQSQSVSSGSASASGSGSASGSASAQTPAGSTDSSITPDTPPAPSAVPVRSLSLNKEDFTLTPNEFYTIKAILDPADTTDQVTWSTSDPKVATVDDSGKVTNVNGGKEVLSATITASCGSQRATCVVRCKGNNTLPSSGSGSSTDKPEPPAPSADPAVIAPGTACVITNAGSGLRIRSGPGTDNEVLASTTNGSDVTVLGDGGNGWYKIRFTVGGGKDQEGYVMKEFVAPK